MEGGGYSDCGEEGEVGEGGETEGYREGEKEGENVEKSHVKGKVTREDLGGVREDRGGEDTDMRLTCWRKYQWREIVGVRDFRFR